MAHYDTIGLKYDNKVFYDEPDPPFAIHRPMSKIKLNLYSLGIEQKVTLGANIHTAMTGNATFPTPNPTLTNYNTAVTGLNTKHAAVVALQSQLKTAMSERDAAESFFDALTTQLASYVDNIAAGDPVKIQSAGMGVKATRTPIGVPAQVANLSLTVSDIDGQLDAQWDRVRGAKTYDLQVQPRPYHAHELAKPRRRHQICRHHHRPDQRRESLGARPRRGRQRPRRLERSGHQGGALTGQRNPHPPGDDHCPAVFLISTVTNMNRFQRKDAKTRFFWPQIHTDETRIFSISRWQDQPEGNIIRS